MWWDSGACPLSTALTKGRSPYCGAHMKTTLRNYMGNSFDAWHLSMVTLLKSRNKNLFYSVFEKRIVLGWQKKKPFLVFQVSSWTNWRLFPLPWDIVLLPHTTSYIHKFLCVRTLLRLTRGQPDRKIRNGSVSLLLCLGQRGTQTGHPLFFPARPASELLSPWRPRAQ